MGYHRKEIQRGQIGEFSKIVEEFQELQDGFEQGNPILVLVELSDLIGAIELFAQYKYNLTLDDLIKMKDATARAFKDGSRKPRDQ